MEEVVCERVEQDFPGAEQQNKHIGVWDELHVHNPPIALVNCGNWTLLLAVLLVHLLLFGVASPWLLWLLRIVFRAFGCCDVEEV